MDTEHPNNLWVQSADFQCLSLLTASSQLSHRDADHVLRALQISAVLIGIWAFIGILSKGTGQGLTAHGASQEQSSGDRPAPAIGQLHGGGNGPGMGWVVSSQMSQAGQACGELQTSPAMLLLDKG